MVNESEIYSEMGNDEVHELVEGKDIEGLINVLKYNKKSNCIKLAAYCLSGMGVEKAVAPLFELALKNKTGLFRRVAIVALCNLGNHKAVEPLIYLMGKHDYLIGEIVEAVGNLKDDRAVKPLNMLMNDENEEQDVREKALESLCKIGTQEAIADVIAILNKSSLDEKASVALIELGEVVIQPLIKKMSSENGIKVVEILGEIGSCQAAKPLLALFETYITDDCIKKDSFEKPLIPIEIVRAIVKTNDALTIARTVEMLINALKPNPLHTDFDYTFQCSLIFALGEIQDKRVIKPLVQLLFQSDESRIVYTAAYALAMLGSKIDDPTVIKQLTGVLEDARKYGNIRNFIAWALLQTDENKAAIPLIKYLKYNYMEILRNTLFTSPDMLT